jgi:hypothetical protein
MAWLARFVPAAALAAMLFALPDSAAGQPLCLSNADCPTTPLGGGRSCTKQKVFGFELPFGRCGIASACNGASDCIPQAECRDDFCQRPAGTCVVESDCLDSERCVAQRCEPASPGKGTGVPGEGRHCVPPDGSKPDSWAQDKNGKPLGACPVHTLCNQHGICVRIPT